MRVSVLTFPLLSLALCAGCADKSPPTFPGEAAIALDHASASALRIHWPVAHDDRQVHAYRVYRDDEQVAELTGGESSYTLDELEPSTDYLLAVVPLDAAGNMGERLSLVASTVDGEPPAFGAGARLRIRDVTPADMAQNGQVDLELTWPAATDASGVTRYDITHEGQLVTSVSGDQLSYRLESAPGEERDGAYGVTAQDAAGNRSAAIAGRFPALDLDHVADATAAERAQPVNVSALADQPALHLDQGISRAIRPQALERIRLLGAPILTRDVLAPPNMTATPTEP